MDDIDRAQALETRQRQEALARFASARRKPTNSSLTHCAACGEPIPEVRRLAVPGCRLCVGCQAQREATL